MRNPEKVSARRANLLGDRPGAFAEAKFLRMSATKVRRVIDMVRGEDVITALAILRYAPQAAAVPARKLLESAIANAENQEGLEMEDLFVSAVFADEGATLRRIRPRAKGSASRILKRGAHLTIVVEPHPEELAEKTAPKGRAARAAAKTDTGKKTTPPNKGNEAAKKAEPAKKADAEKKAEPAKKAEAKKPEAEAEKPTRTRAKKAVPVEDEATTKSEKEA